MFQRILHCSQRLPTVLIRRNFSELNTPRVCIVGAGPAGFYAAQYILKNLKNSHVDMIERYPVPFGLVRYGVAPDHPEVKNVINTFTKTAENPRFHFYGNVSLGKDVTLQQLRQLYHSVMLTYGADRDRKLDIPNEDKLNVLSARYLVSWYNGVPGAENLSPDLSADTVVIIGQGNVAIDVARILLTPIDQLKTTDITEYALEALACSKVQRIYLVGRRSPLEVAFTIKELRELLKMNSVATKWRQEDFNGIPEIVDTLPRPRKRLLELMLKSLTEQTCSRNDSLKEFLPVFLRSPKSYDNREITFTVNRMEGETAIPTNEYEILPAGLVIRSIGYKASCADNGICFDPKSGRVFNEDGRVVISADNRNIDCGLYVAGWLGTGPSGVILSTMNNAFAVGKNICDDILNGQVDSSLCKGGVEQILQNKPIVTWLGWQKIDAEERRRGQLLGKPREKIVQIAEMLKFAGI